MTSDVDERLDWHNGGHSGYTVNYRPWRVIVSLEFPDEQSAVRFEKYLKSGSGRAFARRHFGASADGEDDSLKRDGEATKRKDRLIACGATTNTLTAPGELADVTVRDGNHG